MAAQNVPRGSTSDWLHIDAAEAGLIEVIEGPNLTETPENVTQINQADGTFLQEDATRRRVSGVQKFYVVDDSFDNMPEAGEVWTRANATAAPYKVRIDEVNDEGETEDGYQAHSVAFHYFEDVEAVAGDATISG